jgi:hypothetical protein
LIKFFCHAIFLIILLLLAACGKERMEVFKIGVVSYKKYYKTEPIRWEGPNAHYERAELCSPKLKECLKGKFISISQFDSPTNGKLAVTIQEELSQGLDLVKTRNYILSTVTGAEIMCKNCDDLNLDYGNGAWLRNGNIFIPTKIGQEKSASEIIIIEFSYKTPDQISRERTLQYMPQKNSFGYGLSYSPNLVNRAWFSCDPACTLYWFNKDLTEINRINTECASKGLYIIWDNQYPRAVLSHWAKGTDLCINEKGNSTLMQLSFEEETRLNLLQPGRGNVYGVRVYR